MLEMARPAAASKVEQLVTEQLVVVHLAQTGSGRNQAADSA